MLVQNLAPGAAARLGLSYEALQREHPELIVCDISGYGVRRPVSRQESLRPADPERIGFPVDHRHAGEPAKAGCSIADIAAGMYAYSNILAALIQRGKTGRGCRIDVSMLESMVEWMGYPLYYSVRRRAAPAATRRSPRHDLSVWPVSCGRWPDGDARSSERTRMDRLLRAVLSSGRNWRGTRAFLPIRAERQRERSCARSSPTCFQS